MKTCFKCKQNKDLSNFYFSKKSNKYSAYCISCEKILQNERHMILKYKCVEYKGGKCTVCGYNKSLAALEFHHLDPKQKDFGIGAAKSHTFNEKIKKELDKCILLCSNCHKELHCMYNTHDIENLLIIQNNKSLNKTKSICICGNTKCKNTKYCRNCYKLNISSKIPQKNELESIIFTMPLYDIAKKYNVGDTCVIKWCKKYNIKRPGRGYWQKFNINK